MGVVKGHGVYVEETPQGRPLSFLQARGNTLRGSVAVETRASQKVQELLEASASKLHSPVLAMAALKVNAAEDHFVKVRQIIKDLIAKLESDASAEATQKAFCDKEKNKAAISGKQAAKARLERDIAELSAAIAANKKALLGATELREKEKAENLERIEQADAGRAAVQQALNVLKQFY